MNYYAGLDVSLEETAICVVDEQGRIVRELRAASDPAALITTVRGIGLSLERIGLEACSLTAWLHDGLRAAGFPAICIETRQANAAMKTMPNKTDRNDARALAQIMRTGWFRQVHVKSRQCRLWRSLLVARRTVLNEMRSIENVVRAILREAGVKLGMPSRATFAERVRELVGACGCSGDRVGGTVAENSRHDAGAIRSLDQAGSRCRPERRDLPAADECSRCWSDYRARFPGND